MKCGTSEICCRSERRIEAVSVGGEKWRVVNCLALDVCTLHSVMGSNSQVQRPRVALCERRDNNTIKSEPAFEQTSALEV